MHILCLGINHQTANINLRERLAFSESRLEPALARLGCGGGSALLDIQEMVILSTCNRVEIYAVTSAITFDALEGFMAETSGVSLVEFSPHTYRLMDEDAISHLLRVAAGLDSLVLGEPQILGQVTEALAKARSQGVAGKILSRLFQTAIFTGKRARSETVISHNPVSIASVAVKKISQIVPNLSATQIMVLGAGEMAELAVEALIKRGTTQIVVVNRTLERAETLAKRWGGRASTFEAISDLLPEADILITSTGAPHTILHPPVVVAALESRPERPLVIMDIAVPRDVDPEINNIPGVSLFDMDALSTGLEESLAKRQAEVPKVEAILEEEQVAFLKFLSTLDVVPIIVEMRAQANTIRQAELEKIKRRIPELSPEIQNHIDTLTKSIVKKILHSPTIRLREEAYGPNASDYAEITRNLFGLD
jgi:glutamyl-tRNA reductase